MLFKKKYKSASANTTGNENISTKKSIDQVCKIPSLRYRMLSSFNGNKKRPSLETTETCQDLQKIQYLRRQLQKMPVAKKPQIVPLNNNKNHTNPHKTDMIVEHPSTTPNGIKKYETVVSKESVSQGDATSLGEAKEATSQVETLNQKDLMKNFSNLMSVCSALQKEIVNLKSTQKQLILSVSSDTSLNVENTFSESSDSSESSDGNE